MSDENEMTKEEMLAAEKAAAKAAKAAEKEAAKAAKEAEKAAAAGSTASEAPVAATPAVAGKKPFVRKPHWPEGFVPTGDRIKDTKTLLDMEPKVTFLCPLGPEEKPGAEEIAQINGHKYTIKKGHMVELPRSVAELIANKYRIELEVMQRAQAFATPAKTAALAQ